MVTIIVAGCAGRMGQRITHLALKNKNITVGGVCEYKDHPSVNTDIGSMIGAGKTNLVIMPDLSHVMEKGDIIIEFTNPRVTVDHVNMALKHKKKMVIGTTGLSTKEQDIIKEAAQQIAIVFAPNMSVGVNLLFKLSHMVASTLGNDYDVEIVEAHHKFKKDAPSGTAHEIARQIAAARDIKLSEGAVYGRAGFCGERQEGTIGIHAVRGGDVVGEHTVSFMTEGERIELTHRASSRDAFAKGALVAAQFISRKKKGLFTMQDVLGIT